MMAKGPPPDKRTQPDGHDPSCAAYKGRPDLCDCGVRARHLARQAALLRDTRVERAASALEAEVNKRNEHYGLDNWTFEEVARFVIDAADGGK